MLGKFVSESQRDWDIKVPAVMAAYRETVHDAIGCPPNLLLFGRELRAPIDRVLGAHGEVECTNQEEFVEAVRHTQQEAYTLAPDHLGRRAERNKHSHDM